MMSRESSKISVIGKGIEDFFSTLANYKRLIILIIIIISMLSCLPVKVLMARDYKTGDYIKSWKVNNKDEFTIEYTHSVQLTKVTETYLIKDKNIILLESYFHSLGAGLPATTPYKFEVTQEGFRIYDINEKIDYLVYRTGAQRANHSLKFNGRDYKFLDFSKPRTGVKLTTEKMILLSYVIREGFY